MASLQMTSAPNSAERTTLEMLVDAATDDVSTPHLSGDAPSSSSRRARYGIPLPAQQQQQQHSSPLQTRNTNGKMVAPVGTPGWATSRGASSHVGSSGRSSHEQPSSPMMSDLSGILGSSAVSDDGSEEADDMVFGMAAAVGGANNRSGIASTPSAASRSIMLGQQSSALKRKRTRSDSAGSAGEADGGDITFDANSSYANKRLNTSYNASTDNELSMTFAGDISAEGPESRKLTPNRRPSFQSPPRSALRPTKDDKVLSTILLRMQSGEVA